MNTFQEARRLWSEISTGTYFFTRREKYAEYVATISRQDLLAFYSTFLLPASERRRKFSSQFYGAGRKYPCRTAASASAAGSGERKQVLITDPSAFKRASALRAVTSYDSILPIADVPATAN
jgi:hypothetical protein